MIGKKREDTSNCDLRKRDSRKSNVYFIIQNNSLFTFVELKSILITNVAMTAES